VIDSFVLPKLSICICTYNRSESLKHTLLSLASQKGIESASIEILIVDNNSTDSTQNILEEFRKTLRICDVRETHQGLAYARNRAVMSSKGEVILFTDDDVRLEYGWLAAYQAAIERFPKTGYFGGRILPDWEGTKPAWIGEKPLPLIDGLLVWFDHGVQTRPFGPTESLPFGASFAVRRTLFDKIGLFQLNLGTGGAGSGRGEETEFLMRAQKAGAKGVYVGEALCLHRVDPRRLRLRGLFDYGVVTGKSHNLILGRINGSYSVAASFLLRALYQFVKGHNDRFRQCIVNAGIQVATRHRPEFRTRKQS
jgi:glycosyltransferase involved in cell wall biosynthesis